MNITIRMIMVLAGGLAICTTALAGSHSVRGHVTKQGTYVPPHRATNPNGTRKDNWSSKGNYNPYTGKKGTKNPKK